MGKSIMQSGRASALLMHSPKGNGHKSVKERKEDMPNEEIIMNRIEELESYIQNFPNSRLVRCFQNEINYLTAILEHRSLKEIEYLKSLL